MVRFLRLAVERALAGQADELKEYLIGVEVFDRKASYDPRVDPIVRVEARRLRAKLKAYYEGDGCCRPGAHRVRLRRLRAAPEPCVRRRARDCRRVRRCARSLA